MNISSLSTIPVQMPQQSIKPQIDKNTKNVHAAAVKFEGMFMNEMLSHMFEGVDSETSDNPLSGGHGEQVFRSMLTEQYGKMVSESGQTGLSKEIEKTMLRMQEEQANPRLKTDPRAGKSFDPNSGTDNASQV